MKQKKNYLMLIILKETKPLSIIFIKTRTLVVTGDVIMSVENERIEQNCYFVNII